MPNARGKVKFIAAVVWQPVEFGRSVRTYKDRSGGYSFESTISRRIARLIYGAEALSLT